jgi:hypothetical protein
VATLLLFEKNLFAQFSKNHHQHMLNLPWDQIYFLVLVQNFTEMQK